MKLDDKAADVFLDLSFGKLEERQPASKWPAPATLVRAVEAAVGAPSTGDPLYPHEHCHLFASASIEYWHRAIHSFLWSVASRDSSPIWSSVAGYYASHFVARAVSHSLGVFKTYDKNRLVQVVVRAGKLVCDITEKSSLNEHEFYWRIAKSYPRFNAMPIFKNNGRKTKGGTDSSHRVFANYLDHIDSFAPLRQFDLRDVKNTVKHISLYDRYAVTDVSRERYPDLNVQILAYQRIVEFRDFLDDRLGKNRVWAVHRDPQWSKPLMTFFLREAEDAAPRRALSDLAIP